MQRLYRSDLKPTPGLSVLVGWLPRDTYKCSLHFMCIDSSLELNSLIKGGMIKMKKVQNRLRTFSEICLVSRYEMEISTVTIH